MNRKSILALFITSIMIITSILSTFPALGQATPEPTKEGKLNLVLNEAAARIVNRYREDADRKGKQKGKKGKQTEQALQAEEQPDWAKEALCISLDQLQGRASEFGLLNAHAEFKLLEAIEDGRGYKDVRLDQLHNGVEVFGGQIMTHLDNNGALVDVSGHFYDDARIDTTPMINEAQAIEAAKSALGHSGEFSEEPVARLVILPEKVRTGEDKVEGATLTYLVQLLVEEIQKQGNHQYFINALDGSVRWYYDDTQREVGTGKGFFHKKVKIDTSPHESGGFTLLDPERGFSRVRDGNLLSPKDPNEGVGSTLIDFDNRWGNGKPSNIQTQAVDAYYGIAKIWDYFEQYGWFGVDGKGKGITGLIRARFLYSDSNGNERIYSDNATYSPNGNIIRFGSGDGITTNPWIAIDTVGHEFTHAVTKYSADLIYAKESGAINESFSDIFGTAIEFFADPENADYLRAEDIFIQGGFLRDMQDPTRAGHPDHYADRVGRTCLIPDPSNDWCGVHTNSGIMNKAFYLMAEGGTHRGTFVPKIGRNAAEAIFFAALIRYLTKSSKFIDVANATKAIAERLYGSDGARAVERAWVAVGVLPTTGPGDARPVPVPDLSRGRAFFYNPANGFGETGRLDQQGKFYTQRIIGGFALGWTHIVDMGNQLFFFNRDSYSCAVGHIEADGDFVTTQGFTLPGRNLTPVGRGSGRWTHVTYSNGLLFFYNSNYGTAQIGEVTAGGYRRWKNYGIDSFGLGWSHIVGVQGRMMFYNDKNGAAAVGELRKTPGPNFGEIVDVNFVQLGGYRFETGWTHIVNAGSTGGVFTNANQRGLMFYNANTGQYVVGDIDTETGAYTVRVPLSSRWSYSMLQPGWKHIVRMGEGLFFYGNESAMVGQLLTASGSDLFAVEPFQVINTYPGNFFVGPYPMLSSTYSF